jgi:hypothetical protein
VIRRKSVTLRPSSWDTAVILLQNDLGAVKWAVDNDTLKQSFCKAFRDAAKDIPTESATIAKWENRGLGKDGRASFAQYFSKAN